MTTTVNKTLASHLNSASPDNLPDVLRVVELGTILTPQKRDITIASGTVITLDPPSLNIGSTYVNVITGTATGVCTVADVTETPSATLVTLSDDGVTLTFEAVITVATVDYIPRSASDITADFPQTGNG